nr:hypothetical protein BaRGS_031625 [Batillaria attramentaria]
MMLIVVGTVGNILVLLVYWLRIRPDVPRVFILAMGVCDLLTSVVGLPLQLATIRACNMASKYDAFEGYKRIQERTTRMMAVLTILYVINWLPHLIASVVYKKNCPFA